MMKIILSLALCMTFYQFVELKNNQTKFTTRKPSPTTAKLKIHDQTCNKTHGFKVEKILDGDTATVKNASGKHSVKIRFRCIDAPEKDQPKWGVESLKKLNHLLPPKTNVTLLSCHKDPYNRTVAEVIDHKGININKEILKLGYVVAYPFEKGCDEYLRIEKDAREHKRGIHADKTFEKPWDWRKKNNIGLRGQGKINLK